MSGAGNENDRRDQGDGQEGIDFPLGNPQTQPVNGGYPSESFHQVAGFDGYVHYAEGDLLLVNGETGGWQGELDHLALSGSLDD